MGIGVGEEGEAGQSKDVCAVFAAAPTAALVTLLDVTQNLQATIHPLTQQVTAISHNSTQVTDIKHNSQALWK